MERAIRNMIVVHPYDESTRMLSELYKGIEGVTLFDSWEQQDEIYDAIAAAPKDEFILLLGHGCPYGLYDMRYGIIVGDGFAELLKDRPNLIGIWCYASSFAYEHNLKGFFSGMFISEKYEAEANGVDATAEEVDEKVWDFCRRFGEMMRKGLPLRQIAAELMDEKYVDSDLTQFNYSKLIFRETGLEGLVRTNVTMSEIADYYEDEFWKDLENLEHPELWRNKDLFVSMVYYIALAEMAVEEVCGETILELVMKAAHWQRFIGLYRPFDPWTKIGRGPLLLYVSDFIYKELELTLKWGSWREENPGTEEKQLQYLLDGVGDDFKGRILQQYSSLIQ